MSSSNEALEETPKTSEGACHKLPVELWRKISWHLPPEQWPSMRLISPYLRAIIDGDTSLQYDLDLFSAGLEGTSPYYGPHKRMLCRYNRRWDNFDSSAPITVPIPQPSPHLSHIVSKGYLVFFSGTRRMTRFHFTRLPSPLMGDEPITRVIDVPYPANCGWDFCPFLDLLVVGTSDGNHRSFKVHFWDMSRKRKYCDDLDPPGLCSFWELEDRITRVDLMLTRHRLAAKVSTSEYKDRVFVWNWEDGKLYLEHLEAREFQFIDEYRLLCAVEKKLQLWDFTAESDHGSVTFLLEPGNDVVSHIRRSYELFDTQPFRVDPEAGIVVLGISGCTYELVIPTKVFVGFKTPRKRGLLGEIWERIVHSDAIEWENWSHFVTKMEIGPFFPFHSHTLCILPYEVDNKRTLISLLVYDFSLYSRRRQQTLQRGVMRALRGTPSVRRPLVPAVARSGGFFLDTSEIPHNDHGFYPTENGVLVIKPGANTASFWRAKVDTHD